MSDDRDYFAGCTVDLDDLDCEVLDITDVLLLFAGRTAVEIVKATVEGEER